MMNLSPNQLPNFDVHTEPVGPRWTKWISRSDNYLVAMDITDAKRQCALLLHFAGEDVHEIYETLTVPDPEPTSGETAYESMKSALKNYFEPKRNVHYEIYMFQSARQEPNESLDEFVTRLRKLAKHCEFTNTDREIQSRIIQGCISDKLRRKALLEEMTLSALLSAGRVMENAEKQAKEIENQHKQNHQSTVNRVLSRNDQQRQNNRKPQHNTHNQYSNSTICGLCGGKYTHPGGQNSCPARGKDCYSCGKKNNFSKMWRQQSSTVNNQRPSTYHNQIRPTTNHHRPTNIRD